MKTMKGVRIFAICLPPAILLLSIAAFFLPPLWLPVCALALWGSSRTGSPVSVLLAVITAGVFGVFCWGWSGLLLPLLVALPLITGFVALRKGKPFLEGLGYSLLATLMGCCIIVGTLTWLTGGDMVAAFLQNIGKTLSADTSGWAVSLLAGIVGGTDVNLVFSPTALMEKLQELSALSVPELWAMAEPALDDLCRLLLPSLIAAIILLLGGVPYLVTGYLLRQAVARNHPVPAYFKPDMLPPVLADWDLPRWVLIPLVLLMAAWMVLSWFAEGTLLSAAYALRQITDLVLALQGMALLAWFGRRKHWKTVGWVFLIIGAAIVLNGQILVYAGVVDALFRIRQVTAFREKMLAEQKLRQQMVNREEPENKDNDENNDTQEDGKQ